VETYSKYADVSNVAHIIFPIIPQGVAVQGHYSLRQDVIGWKQSTTTGKTLCKKVVVRQFAGANNVIVASVSNGSGLPGFGLGWNRPEGPGPGQEPRSNPTRCGLPGLLPEPDINPQFLTRLNLDCGFIFAVPATATPIKYLSSDRITI
jgi:hypothetical protein